MPDTALPEQDPGELVALLEEASGTLEHGLINRWVELRQAGGEWNALKSAVEAKGMSLPTLALLLIGSALVTYLLILTFQAVLNSRKSDAKGWRRAALAIGATLLACAVMFIATRFGVSDLDIRRAFRLWIFATALFWILRVALRALFPVHQAVDAGLERDTRRFRETISLAILWAFVGIAIGATLRIFQAGPGLRDLIASLLVVAPVTFLLAYAYWQHKHVVRHFIAPPETGSWARRRIGALWPWIAITVMVLTVLVLQVGVTVGRPLPPLAILLTLVLVLVAPHLDGAVTRWSERATTKPDISIVGLALRRTTRFVIAIAILCLLIYLWVLPLLTAVNVEASAIAKSITEIGLISLAAAFLWNAVGAVVTRVALAEGASVSSEETGGPRTRLGTLLPLLSGVVKVSLIAVSLLTVLVALGINVWPIIGGLSIFGIAIGFGSQTLVKDVVSGLFFLIDDAFRLGEYIETPGAKGTVEKISVRSVSLRNARGALASVPYGQIGKVINFSRGWVIEKMVFRVAFDTDVELVRKLFKTIGQQIANDPELSADLLEPFKSQGISAVEDGTLLIRGKFKARAGKQFAVKKAVLTAVQKAFRENDIHAVPRPLAPPTPS